MPSLERDNYPHNAKITEFYCRWCDIKSFAKYKKAKYCSDLCRHNAYLNRKEMKTIKERDYDANVTQKSHHNYSIRNVELNKSDNIKIVGSRNVKIYFSNRNINITLKSLKEMEVDDNIMAGEYLIIRTNSVSWQIERKLN